jgi:hypothetical protein
VANPLGFARGKHQLGVFLYTLVNLASTVRTTPGYIQVAGIVLETDMKKFGPLVCFAGVDPQTGRPDPKLWATPSAQLRALDCGVHMNLPALSAKPTPTHAWLLLFLGDMLAVHKLNPFVESPSAYCPCRACDWDTRKVSAYEPVHFLKEGAGCRWKLYTTEFIEESLAALRKLSATAAAPHMQNLGVNSLDHALSPKYNPHFRHVESSPQVMLMCV